MLVNLIGIFFLKRLARNLIMTGKPLESYLPSYFVKTNNGHVNSAGYGNNDKNWVIRG